MPVLRILERMTDRELIKKLNSLKNVGPDSAWMSSNRDILLSQISNSGARELSTWKMFVINFNSFVKVAAQPAYALGMFLLVLVGGGLFSHQVFNSAKPNDSLYIARIISEQARLTTVFNSDDRNKLAAKFSLEHARDISTVLADPSFNNEENKDQVAKLSESFSKEIENVKTRISYLSPKTETVQPEIESITPEEGVVSMAGNDKDSKGLQIAEKQPVKEVPVLLSTTSIEEPEIQLSNIASATPGEISSSSVVITSSILDEAQQLTNSKDYQKASEKLQEVSELIK